MNQKSFDLMEKYVPKGYVNQAQQVLQTHENEIRLLLEKGKMPEHEWPEERIHLLLDHFSLMDSNNFGDNCGLGEREGRIFSSIVARRNFHFAHGIGRSGDLNENQPKAVGSSVLNKLANDLVLDLVKLSGLNFVKSCLITPMATGMTLTFCMLSIREEKPDAKYVLMPRIDQKSCIKSIIAAGYTPVIIEPVYSGDELTTNLNEIEKQIHQLKPENIACILCTTSCFAPRSPDRVEEIAELCKRFNIFHLVNNAYGLQSSKSTHMINQASRTGRVDILVQSTDKNLMVPVGGAIIAAFDDKKLKKIAQFYPGRASFSQSLDVLVTILQMGVNKYKQLLTERKECFQYLKEQLVELAKKYNERVLESPHNTISLAFSLTKFGTDPKQLTHIGSMLFTRLVCGVRVITPGQDKQLGPHLFRNFGAHTNETQCAYFTAAAAIGIKKTEIDVFIKRLDKVLESIKTDHPSHQE